MSRQRVSLYLDCLLLIAFVVLGAGAASIPLAVHEWLGIAFVVASVVHVALQWRWIVAHTTLFSRRLLSRPSLNYSLNALLFIAMTVSSVSGFAISRSALTSFGIRTTANGLWDDLHSLSSNTAVAVVGLHLALNWDWLKNAIAAWWRHSRRPLPRVPDQLERGSASKTVWRPIGYVVAAALVLSALTFGVVRAVPPLPLAMEIDSSASIDHNDRTPLVWQRVEDLGASILIVAGSAVAGRVVLRLRLKHRRA